MYEKAVNTDNRNEMIQFLTGHFRYFTMNSWNGCSSYANNVKIYNLGLTKEQEDIAYQLLDPDVDTNALNDQIAFLIEQFYEDTGYTVSYNGRSSGYLVLYETKRENNKMRMYPGRSIDQNEDFEDWSDEDLKERVELVCKFDRLCDDIREQFLQCCRPDCIQTQTVTIVTEQRYLVLPEDLT